jgi:hypothetical protein
VESTRIRPSRLFATRTGVVCVGVVFDGAGRGDALAVPPPPQTASTSALRGNTAAPAKKVMRLLRVIVAPSVGSIDSRSDERLSNHATRSPRLESLVVAGSERLAPVASLECHDVGPARALMDRSLELGATRFNAGANVRRCPLVARYSLRASRSWQGVSAQRAAAGRRPPPPRG